MRALLFSVLVSFNLVACVTGDNEGEDLEMPTGEITAAQPSSTVDLDDVAAEDAQIRPAREVPATPNQIKPATAHQQPSVPGSVLEPVGQLPKLQPDVATEQMDNEPLEQIDQDELHGKVIDKDLPALQQN
jgi:hypothetical protein